MLSDYPIKINNEVIPEPLSWQEDSGVIESVNETEAGTDLILITRYDKLTVSCSFQCSHRWAKKFKEYSKENILAVSLYDVLDENYKIRNMRIRDYKASLIENSWRTPGTNGLWDVSFSLIEF